MRVKLKNNVTKDKMNQITCLRFTEDEKTYSRRGVLSKNAKIIIDKETGEIYRKDPDVSFFDIFDLLDGDVVEVLKEDTKINTVSPRVVEMIKDYRSSSYMTPEGIDNLQKATGMQKQYLIYSMIRIIENYIKDIEENQKNNRHV